jgi:two-component system, OmpR family, response regulator PrrA
MVLMVDDDPDVRTSVARGLRHSGFDVRVAATGKEALRLLSNESHDALVLDVQMPELDGVAVVTALRALGNDIPICVLSARDTVNDRIAGLEAGADDYLTKPFSFEELLARLRALTRRAPAERPVVVEVGALRLDPAAHRAWRDGTELELSAKEFALLELLMRRRGHTLTRGQLLEGAWDMSYERRSNIVDVYIRHLREKIDRPFDSDTIETVRGVGYRLREDA